MFVVLDSKSVITEVPTEKESIEFTNPQDTAHEEEVRKVYFNAVTGTNEFVSRELKMLR